MQALGSDRLDSAEFRYLYILSPAAAMSAEPSAPLEALHRLSDTASAPALLSAVLLPVQSMRSAAYGRLNVALRHRADGGREDGMDGYSLACANCTEDLKLASEAADALRRVLELRGRNRGAREAKSIVARVQVAEESKMLALVSVHALKRSREKGGDRVLEAIREQAGASDADHDETYEAKIVRFSKNLAALDELIYEIIEEAREMIAEEEEVFEQE
jgi:hypothetical protein